MNIVDPRLDEYLLKITPARHEILVEMEKLAGQRNFPIIGPLVGRVLFQYARLTSARRIMELGSGYGYSAFWWALGTPPDAKIYCTEGSAENVSRGKDFLSRAQLLHKVDYHQGDALETMRKIPGEFDIIFMDIDKHQYPEGFRQGFPRLLKGGLFITDNVLWSGRVVEPNADASTAGIVEYNRLIYSSPGAFSTILPLRDGVGVTYKDF